MIQHAQKFDSDGRHQARIALRAAPGMSSLRAAERAGARHVRHARLHETTTATLHRGFIRTDAASLRTSTCWVSRTHLGIAMEPARSASPSTPICAAQRLGHFGIETHCRPGRRSCCSRLRQSRLPSPPAHQQRPQVVPEVVDVITADHTAPAGFATPWPAIKCGRSRWNINRYSFVGVPDRRRRNPPIRTRHRRRQVDSMSPNRFEPTTTSKRSGCSTNFATSASICCLVDPHIRIVRRPLPRPPRPRTAACARSRSTSSPTSRSCAASAPAARTRSPRSR